MSSLTDFKTLPPKTKATLSLGVVLALVVALPLFIWTAIYTNFNINEGAADDGSNYCGGTCGSNFNCQPNLYCYKGFCRNPICSDDTDCTCSVATATPTSSTKATTASTSKTATPKVSSTPTMTAEPKGGNNNFGNLANVTPNPLGTITPSPTLEPSQALENQFFAKYAIYIFVGFVLLVISVIVYAVKRSRSVDIPHILPPTNI